jgi:hypothetical protein
LVPFAKSLSLSAGTRSGRRSDPVNEAFAAKYFGGQNPIGRTFTIEPNRVKLTSQSQS